MLNFITFQMLVKSLSKAFSICLLISISSLHAQNQQKVDSLLLLIQHTNTIDTIKVKAYNDLGIEYALSAPKLAKKYINSALHLATQIERPRGVAGSYNCLGIVDYHQKDYNSALSNFQKALAVNIELEHLWGQAAALNQIGVVQNLKDDYNGAIQSFKKAGELFKKMNDSIAWAASIQNIGVSYLRMEYHQKAIESYLKAIQLYEKLNNTVGIARSYMHIGVILNKQEEYHNALKYLTEALTKVKEVDNKSLLGSILKNTGISYHGLHDYKSALVNFREALTYKKAGKNKKIIASIQASIGDTYYQLKEYKKALSHQQEALNNHSNNKSKVQVQNSISKTLIKLNTLTEAKVHATQALQISQTNANLEGEKEAYYNLAMIAKNEEKYQEALTLYINFHASNDSLITHQNQQQVRKLRAIYETEKGELTIATQEKDISLLNTQNNQKKQWLLFGSAGLFLLFGFILLLRSRNSAKKKKKLQEAFSQNLIEAQENERTRVAKDLHDSVGQQLTFIKKKAQNLEQTELSLLINTALEEVRSISRDLYPATLKQLGLTASIEQLLFDLDGETAMFFSVEIDDINSYFDESETLNFYRFIQESVNNVLKHSLAKTLIINIIKSKKDIEVLIKDNGQGFIASEFIQENSLGLKTMAYRIHMLKGSISIKSEKQVGTTILVKIPV